MEAVVVQQFLAGIGVPRGIGEPLTSRRLHRSHVALLLLLSLLPLWAPGTALGQSIKRNPHDCFQVPSSEPENVILRCTPVINAPPSKVLYERALNRRGLAFSRLNKKIEALRDFDALIASNQTSAGYFDNRREVLRSLGQLDRALTDANEAVRLSPALAYVYHNRGDVNFDMGRFDLAIIDYTTAYSKKEAFIESIINRGRSYVKLRVFDKAIDDFTKVLEDDPSASQTLKERAFAYIELGLLQKAEADLLTFLQREPSDSDARQALARLGNRTTPEQRSQEQHPSAQSSSGTGFFVTAKEILTNNHVIKDCGSNPIMVSYPERRPERAYISGQDDTNDLVILHTELANASVASFRLALRLGEPVATYGFPLAGLLSSSGNFTLGNITSLTGLGDDTRVLQTSAPIQPGNSGGPLLDMTGSVVGVTEFQLDAIKMIQIASNVPQNVYFAIQTAIVINFLVIKGISPTLAEKGRKALEPADVADLAKAFTVQVRCAPN
jgi:S1-C subfamily serine protease